MLFSNTNHLRKYGCKLLSQLHVILVIHFFAIPALLVEILYLDWYFDANWLASIGNGVRDADKWVLSWFGKIAFSVFYILVLAIFYCLHLHFRRYTINQNRAIQIAKSNTIDKHLKWTEPILVRSQWKYFSILTNADSLGGNILIHVSKIDGSILKFEIMPR